MSIHYGPLGAAPLVLGAFAAVAGTLAMGIRRRGFEAVIAVDLVERHVVTQRAFGPFHWKRRAYEGEELEEARVERDDDGSFVNLVCRSGRLIQVSDRPSLRHGVHERLATDLNAFLRKSTETH